MPSKRFAFLKNEEFHSVLIFVLAIAITYIAVMSAYPYKKYSYKEFDVAEQDIKAPYQIENTYEIEKLAEINRDNAEPVVVDRKSQVTKSIETANTFFSFVSDLREFYLMDITDGNGTYKRTLTEFNNWLDKNNIILSSAQIDYLTVKIEEDEYFRFHNVTFEIITTVMGNDIQKSNLSDNIILAQNSYRQKGLDQETVSVGQSFISSAIFINREADEYLTGEVKDKAYYQTLQTEKSIIEKGGLIVKKGSVITTDIYNILLEGNMIREKGIKGYFQYIAILIYIIALYVFVLIYIKFFYKKAYKGRKEELLLLLLIAIVLALSRSAMEFSPLLIPLYIAPIMIAVLLELKLALIFNIMLVFIVAIFVPQFDLLFTLFLGGAFCAIFVQNKKLRSRLSLSGLLAAIASAAIYIVSSMIFGSTWQDALKNSIYILISGVFSIVLTVGLLPLFEIIFNVITPGKLLELSNPNQTLLKKLLMEAPGTYHHSLMVGNLAEEATDKIGGNPLLARVGAYYHDIGKSLRPQYFSENQKGENPHNEMNPKLSSFVIVSHVNDGVKLAREFKLPDILVDFIKTHHGNTLTSYFFHKAKESIKNAKILESDYRYSGPRPQTKENAVVMLADSVEAAVKSLDDKSEGKMESYIRKIIKSRLDEGQLDDSDITLKDLKSIAESFSHVLSGYYHTRVIYPDIQTKEEK